MSVEAWAEIGHVKWGEKHFEDKILRLKNNNKAYAVLVRLLFISCYHYDADENDLWRGWVLIGGYYAAFNQAVISPRCVCTCVLSSLYSAFLLFWRRSGLIDPMFYDPKGSFLIGSHFCDL